MKKLLFISVLFLISHSTRATAQVGDIIIWNGDTLSLFSNPLELRLDWEKLHKIILKELFITDSIAHLERYGTSKEYESGISSDCWRGYIAEWNILNNKIYLSNIYSCINPKNKLDLEKVFPSEYHDGLVFAYWIKNKLIIPKGECIEYIHLDYRSIYDKEIVLNVMNGYIKKAKEYDNIIVKRSKFSLDPNPSAMQDFAYSLIDWEKFHDFNGRHILVTVGIIPKLNGRFGKIDWKYTYALDNDKFITDRNNIYIREAIRVAKLIPEWDVIIQRQRIVGCGLGLLFDDNNKEKYKR